MPCPFFQPVSKLNDDAWDPPARMPLGASWAGTCRIAPGFEPTESHLRETCNVGYARHRCWHFPIAEELDAVRFSRAGNGRTLFILEKNHAPLSHGDLAALPAEFRSLADAFLNCERKNED